MAISGEGDRRRRARVGEVAGGTAAECAAVCCCCPFTALNVVFMVVYKVPSGLCRKVKNKRREKARTIKKSLLIKDTEFDEVSDINKAIVPFNSNDFTTEFESAEVWEQFHGAGFWRSPSQREPSLPCLLSKTEEELLIVKKEP